jgi:hypothetical protein
MPIDPRISLGVQPLQIADPVAQYGQVQNILAAQAQRQSAGTQNELAQAQLGQTRMSIQEAQEAQDYVAQVMNAAKKNGAATDDPMDAAMQMLRHPNPKVREAGKSLFDANEKVLAYQQDKLFTNRTAPQPIAATALPPAAGAQTNFGLNDDSFKTWMADKTTNLDFKPWLEQQNAKQTNALAPAAAAPAAAPAQSNALATPSKANQILEEINDLRTRFPYSAKAKQQIEFLTKQYETLSKPYVVGRNLVTGGGENIFTSQQDITPTDIKRLTAERDALPIGHPNRKLYDQAIANLGSSDRLAQERLNFDRQKFAWEKANPGYTIQQAEDGSIVGVNNRTLQAFPVTLSQTPPPANAPFVSGAAPAPANANKPGAAVTTLPIIQPRGEALKGKSSGLTETQGNATAFGMRMKDSHALLKDLENKGETGTGVIRGTVGGVVGLVPFIGDKFTAATDDIFNVLPGILGGMSPEQQQVVNGRINFITAVLRKESGAAISPGEFITAEKLYFPKPGENATVIKQKQKARELAIKAMEIQAGPGAKSIQSLVPGESGTNSFDPLGLFTDK